MNWYKIANFQEDIDSADNLQACIDVLNQHNIEWQLVKFPNNSIIKLNAEGKVYIIPDPEYPQLEKPIDWIYSLSDMDLYNYAPISDDFWENIEEAVVYHGTIGENIETIQEEGLKTQNKTRGISNRSTGSAIFTSTDPYSTESYGDFIIEIDLDKMKQDGFTPSASKEEPIVEAEQRESIARRLGLENVDFKSELESEGIFDNTVIFYEDIPNKYLNIIRR